MELKCLQVQITGWRSRKCIWHQTAPQDGPQGTVTVNEPSVNPVWLLARYFNVYLCYDVTPKERSNNETLSLLIPYKLPTVLILDFFSHRNVRAQIMPRSTLILDVKLGIGGPFVSAGDNGTTVHSTLECLRPIVTISSVYFRDS